MSCAVPQADDGSFCSSNHSDDVGGISEFESIDHTPHEAPSSASGTDKSDCESLFPDASSGAESSDGEGFHSPFPFSVPDGMASEEGMPEGRSS